jgi:two-component system OmpR family response regulator
LRGGEMAQENVGQYRLLAVDDNNDCSELIVRTALKCGYEAFPISDARTLSETISHWRPHLITLDLCLPEVDGFEILSLLKTLQFGGQLIIVSGQPEYPSYQSLYVGLKDAYQASEVEELYECDFGA